MACLLRPSPIPDATVTWSPSYDDLLRTISYLRTKRGAQLHDLEFAYRTIQELRQQVRSANMLKQAKSLQQIDEIPHFLSDLFHRQAHSTAVVDFATSSPNPSYDELLTTIQFLMDENKALSRHQHLTLKMIMEFREQVRYAYKSGPVVPTSGVKPSTWIGGSWLAPSVDILMPAEKLWQNGDCNGALQCVDAVLRRHDMTVEDDFHANLLVSAIKRASGDFGQASKCAEDALVIARHAEDYMLASKAHFHRAFCFFGQDRYAQARFCFALASHLDGYQELIEVNSLLAEEKCRKSPLDHPGRRLDLTCLF
ncbi:MAG: hypothetical protein Q9168_003779 [Polycauliona sp. 1 TL-2023]